MTPLPTDLEILNAIYERHYVDFRDYEKQPPPKRKAKIYVPIDIPAIAKELNVDGDIVFGRLYLHLGPKYYTQKEDGRSKIYFFTRDIEPGKDVVHFPYMASVLAELRAEAKRHEQTSFWSVVAIVVSAVAILVSVFTS